MKKRLTALLSICMIIFTACGQAGSVPQGTPSNTDQNVAASTPEAGEQAASAQSSEAVTEPGDASEKTGAAAKTDETVIPYWTEGSEVMKSIVSYIGAVSNESSEIFVPEEDRIAVFDFDGTLYGELFPTYFDETLLLHRVLHDDTFKADPELLAYAKASEEAYMKGLPQPDTDISTSASLSDSFKGMTVSMKNDFTTIYKEGVTKVVPESWGETSADESAASANESTDNVPVSEELPAADESVAEDTALAPAA